MKKVLALFLTVAMLLSLVPAASAADSEQTASGTVTAEEISGTPRRDELEGSGRQPAAQPLYSDGDIVTVIVQLEGPSLLDYYHPASAASDGFTAGEAVSQFLGEPDVQSASADMLAQQENVLSAISGLQAATFSAYSARNAGIDVVAQWTTLINGMAIRVPYGYLSSIRALDGVKRAYVEHTYDAPEPVFEGAGNAGFSYDMVNLSEVWGAGYTGKGMLVAVVDTGLDLEYSRFGTDDNPTVVDIRRTHEAFRENSFKSELSNDDLRYTKERMSAFLKDRSLNAHRLALPGAVEDAAYKNSKIPFAFDYAGTVDPYTGAVIEGDVNVYPGKDGSNHGTHVAGTIAGYAKTAEGEVKFSGVAPDAQLIIMKVFADVGGGATDSAIMNALEDSLALGADVVNLSLGADNGFALDDTPRVEVYAKLEAAGLILMTSAGNSDFSSYGNERGGYNLASDPEISMMSSPAIYASNIAVASINNTVNTQMTLAWSDGTNEYKVAFTDPYEAAMKSTFSAANMPEGGYEIIPVGGTGTWQDYYDAGFRTSAYGYGGSGKTGIALVQRGELSFVDKITNAQSFVWQDYQQGQMVTGGVKGVIIYDNVDGELFNMGADGTSLTSAAISKADGEAIVAAAEAGNTPKLVRVNQEDEVVSYAAGREMSSFTSWGAGPSLELKPEITAPGGNIWSSVFDTTYRDHAGYYDDYDGSYAMMSGTSMAAPHMSGLAALVRQYVRNTGKASVANEADLTNHLLVSTAVPQMQKDSTAYYSPRRQGAGLVNVGAAITTPAYISVDGQTVGKLELKDDLNWTGTYPVSFQVNNLTASSVTYTVQAAVQRPDTKVEGGHTLMLNSDVLVKTVDLGSVTVPANGTAKVTGTIQLTAAEISQLRPLFPNGTYIEGFITLTSSDESVPQIGLPYLAFLGDWTEAPIFDTTLWIDGEDPWTNGDYTWYPSVVGSALISGGEIRNWINLGQNYFAGSNFLQTDYKPDNLTISPNGDGYLDTIDNVVLYQLRDAKMMVVEVRNAATKELYFRDFANYNTKTLFESSAGESGAAVPTSVYYFTEKDWDGTDLDGNVLPSGTKCIYTITAYGDGDYGLTDYDGFDYPITDFWSVDPAKPETEPTFNGHPMNKKGNVIQFPVVVDYEAPKLVNNAVSVYEEDGHTYIEGTVYDEGGSLASVEVHPVVRKTYKEGYGDPTYSDTYMDKNSPFYSNMIYDEARKTLTFKADVTEYTHNDSYPGESYYSDYTWTGVVIISCGDYGLNDRSYSIRVTDMSQPGQILLSHTSAMLHPGSAFELSVVDNTGAGGALTRTSSNPNVATVDEFGNVVAIAPGQTTITVSNGSSSAVCIVAVEEYPTEVIDFGLSIEQFDGLKPVGTVRVKVTDLQPADVVLNEIRWEVTEDDPDLYSGMITCQKNSQDSLSAAIYLNYSATNDPEITVPGAAGTLRVTLNGVTREMKISWEDLYTYHSEYGGAKDDDMISDLSEREQTAYVTIGEKTTLVATYNDSSAHNVIPVELFGSEIRNEQYEVIDKYPESVGLVLDGKPYGPANGEWRGKLVAQPGYTLPERISIGYRYPSENYEGGYYEYTYWDGSYDSYSHSYNKNTGEIYVAYMPYGTTSSLVIRADGVEAEGAPGGTLSGIEDGMPDGIYGPFNWTWTGGVTGQLKTFEDELFPNGYNRGNGAYFTPSEPGVSYITASSKDGKYSVNFAVICEPILAESLELNARDVALAVGDTVELIPTLTPEPTLAENAEIIWTSFNPNIAQVDENGQITALSDGYAYIKAALKTNTKVQSYCIVKVGTGIEAGPEVEIDSYAISYELDGGYMLSGSSAPVTYTASSVAQSISVPTPVKQGYLFQGWTYAGQTTPTQNVLLPAGFTGPLVLYANWALEFVPTPVVPTPQPSAPGTSSTPSTPETTEPEQSGTKVSTSDVSDDGEVITETTAIPDAVVSGGTAVSTVTSEMGQEIVDQAVRQDSDTVVITPEISGNVTKTEVSIPADTVGEIAGQTDADLQIVTPVASVTIPNEGLSGLAATGGEVSVSAERDGSTVAVTISANGQQVDEVTGGITVSIPQDGCTPGTVAMLVHEDGTTEVIRLSVASSDGRFITVPLDGSATIVIMDNSAPLSDVPSTSWAADAVAFVTSHELMSGTSAGIFDPDVYMTRAMLAKVLHNLENNVAASGGMRFSDVPDGEWYTEAVAWAAAKAIITGYPDGSFGPDDPITREQLAVMLYRYVGSPAVSETALNFTDADQISDYARQAIAWAVANGIMNGKGNGTLDPQGTATRAEVAQLLLNFVSWMA